jgi:hypothetical protein
MMSGNNPDNPDNPDESRRQFLEWASAVGLASIAPATIADVADAQAERPKPDSVPDERRGDPTADVHHQHPTEIPANQQTIERYERTGDPTELINSVLLEHVRENSPETVDVKVRTVGQRSTVVSEGPYERTINGWQPTRNEVAQLERFGTVEFVPEFISTRVELADVDVADLKTIADLGFVIGIAWNPPVEPEWHQNPVPAQDLYSNDYYWFDAVSDDYDIPSNVSIGIIDSGYSGNSDYSGDLAREGSFGIDTSLADEFDPNWDKDDDSYHGDTVTDSAAYMLDNGHNELFVPLKIFGDTANSRTSTEGIEFAERNGIDVINMSFGGPSSDSQCPETYCDELDSYTSAGYFPTASSGNADSDGTVTFPGGEWLSIGVGGIDDSGCSDSTTYSAHDDSNHGTIAYDNCSYCSSRAPVNEQFVPHVYSCYATETGAGNIAGGTSNAAPQAAAAAVIMQSNYLYNYEEAESIFRNMDYYDICPSDEAKEGQLLDAWDAYYQTN